MQLLVLLAALGACYADSSMGKCPEIQPVPGFSMGRFLGQWYAIQTTSDPDKCLSYYFQVDAKREGHYQVTEINQHSIIWSALHHEHNVTGDLTVPDKNQPGRMDLDLPLDIGNTAFTVFLTDYSNYAAVFTCKKYPLFHRWSAMILSRSPSLDMSYVDKVRTRLSSYNIDPFKMEMVPQNDCPEPGTQGSIIRTASNVVANVRNRVFGILASDKEDAAPTEPARIPQYISNIGTFASDTQNKVSDGVRNVQQNVEHAYNQARDKTAEVVDNVQQNVEHAYNQVKDKTSEVIDTVHDKINSNSQQV